jgi:hypothetical protein
MFGGEVVLSTLAKSNIVNIKTQKRVVYLNIYYPKRQTESGLSIGNTENNRKQVIRSVSNQLSSGKDN